MAKNSRNDAWSLEEDAILAETVIDQVKNGGTQLQAFKEVAEKVNRTSAAVGFRWNSEVRKRFTGALEEAKAVKKGLIMEKKKDQGIAAVEEVSVELTEVGGEVQLEVTGPPVSIDSLINLLQEFKEKDNVIEGLTEENSNLKRLLKSASQNNEAQKKEIDKLRKEIASFNEQYESFLHLLQRGKEIKGSINKLELKDSPS